MKHARCFFIFFLICCFGNIYAQRNSNFDAAFLAGSPVLDPLNPWSAVQLQLLFEKPEYGDRVPLPLTRQLRSQINWEAFKSGETRFQQIESDSCSFAVFMTASSSFQLLRSIACNKDFIILTDDYENPKIGWGTMYLFYWQNPSLLIPIERFMEFSTKRSLVNRLKEQSLMELDVSEYHSLKDLLVFIDTQNCLPQSD